MTDEERQRTMDFILQQQAQLAASAQRNEEEHAQFAESFKRLNKTVEQLGRIAAGMARRYRHDRTDLRERIAALIDAQMRSEERLSRTEVWQSQMEERLSRTEDWRAQMEERQARTEAWKAQMEESFARSDARMTRVEEDAKRNNKAIEKLAAGQARNSEAIAKLFVAQDRNREDIAALARVVSDLARARNGGGGRSS